MTRARKKKKVKLAFDRKAALAHDLAVTVHGAGICILAKDTGRVLFLKRSPSSNHPETWDLPGGKSDDGESPDQTARRETLEEIGASITGSLEQMPGEEGFVTYFHECSYEFKPKLDLNEHTEYVWAFPSDPPSPLHPGVKITLDEELAKDANPLSIAAVRLGHKGGLSTSPAKVAASRQNGARHGSDAALAFDRESVRTVDADGRMHVAVSNISKANVCPYLGSEIPDSESLGLDPDKVYMLLRDPEELAKAAPTFNNIQLLSEHVPVSSTDHKPEIIIGCLGSEAVFEAPYLKNSLSVWTEEGIRRVNSGEAQEISCSYRYEADMTPGTYEGENYDGRMTNIVGNHAACVPVGRAGKDVVVGDAAHPKSYKPQPSIGENNMSQTLSKKALRVKGVLQAVLKPLFAADKMPDLNLILAPVTKANYTAKKPLVLAAIKSHLAADANLEQFSDLLDSFDTPGEKIAGDEEDDDLGEDAVEGILAHCRGKMSDDDLGELENKVRAMNPAKKANDEPPADKDTPKVPKAEDADEDDKEDKKDMVSKKAMDSAIKLAAKTAEDSAIARINGIHEARKIATPFVGEIAVACDSADDVYRAALKVLGVKTEGIHPSALRTILELQPNPSTVHAAPLAHDAAPVSGLDKFLADMGLPS